jgi:MFS family permease
MHSILKDLWSDIYTLPRAFWVLTGGQFINRFGRFVFPFLALFLSERGFSPSSVSLVLGAIAAGQMVSPFISGYLADAIGRRNTITLSLVGGALTALSLYYCESLGALVIMSVLHGFFSQMFGPAANALLSDVVPEEKRVTAFAVFRLALNAGFAAGPAVAGFLYTRAPALIFWGDAITTLVFAAGAFALLPHGLRTIEGRVSSPEWLGKAGWMPPLICLATDPFFSF